MDFQKIVWISFVSILILATSSMALADESFLVQSSSSSKLTEDPTNSPHGYIEDISWVKKVSTDGVIEIDGITFSIVNSDDDFHLFEVCAVIEGPLGEFTSPLDNSLDCTSLETLKGNEKLIGQSIDFSKGVKVSDMIGISIIIQEV